ncbi:type II toxin-antitoxin system VapB family antitoxin [Rhizobium sp. LC145]|jgi:antitoxin VapB|uniref:type II toxin-antitoxin system VapB family antitoxin n=1 Tax=Rhizobium sp. LC145 TaxID=1120688 RepID=UPI00062A2CBF|nr:type II toxin-antitoxin system VapB family antitoxin [Rhizobium sp. LC145]KKX32928.1 histidinol dehydrogenase [Rhizobium sp. LC145]TKT57342.1 histidinol dehydrogenase [Rhizobiaceae bacterium LC148]
MPLYVRDDDVLSLAVELQRLTNAPSKTEAVRRALRHEIERTRNAMPIREKLARARAKAQEIGLGDPDFDMKKYTDEMWGDI